MSHAQSGDPVLMAKRFSILRQLGAGGMGVVYEAFDCKRGMGVALKTLPRVDPTRILQFKQEFRSLAGVAHRNLVILYELIADGEEWFFTMELIDGAGFLHYVWPESATSQVDTTRTVSLDNTYDTGELATVQLHAPARPLRLLPLKMDRLQDSMKQLVEGVAALHRAGKLHRDIKPSNVMITKQGRVVLLDLGLAAALDQHLEHHGSEGRVVGTPAYMSPEQAAGQSLSPASDLYSVGVVLFEALTGQLPVIGSREKMLSDKQLYDARQPIDYVPDIPRSMNDLCTELLRRDPATRPTAQEVIERLRGGPLISGLSEVVAERARPDVFVGREEHLRHLHEAYREMAAGTPVTVLVHGRSGVGKSSLMKQFLQTLAVTADPLVLTGRCYEQESVPFKALDSLIDALSQYLIGLSPQEVGPLIPPDISAAALVFPILRRVPSISKVEPGRTQAPDHQELRRQAFAALRELVARIGTRRRLILYLDDLQWGDLDSAVLLAELLRPPQPPVCLLVGCYRSEDVERSVFLQTLLRSRGRPGAIANLREIELGPLTRSESQTLVHALLGEACRPSEVAAIVQESAGNPFFVCELTEHVQTGTALAGRDEQPGTIDLESVLWGRVCKIPEPARRLLEVVAVAGQPVRQVDAYRGAGLVTQDLAVLHQLRAAHLVRTTGPGEEDAIETYHDRVRETVVARLAPAKLQAHHAGLAQALESWGRADPETVALHFQGAGMPGPACRHYETAAARAAETLAFDRAAKLYRLALELRPADTANPRELRVRLADALANAGRGAEAAPEYLAAADGATNSLRLELHRRAATQFLFSGHIDNGLMALRSVLATVGMKLPKTPRRALLSLLLRRAMLRFRGLGFQERAASQVPAAALDRIDICWSAAAGLTMVDTIRGADFQTRTLLLSLQAGEPYRVSRALAWEATHTATAGTSARRRATQLQQKAAAIALRIDHPHARAMATLASGINAYFLGDWKLARQDCQLAEVMFREHCTGVTWELVTAQSFALWAMFFLGDVADLVGRLPALVDAARQRGDLLAEANLTTFGGPLVWLAADQTDEARRGLHDIMDRWSQQGFHVQHFTSLTGQTMIDLYSDDGLGAWARLTKNWSALSRSALLHIEAIWVFMLHLRARSALAAAHQSADPRPLLGAAERDARRLERTRTPWARPLARMIHAAVMASRGETTEAVGMLSTAARELDRRDMKLFAATARHRHGQLLGGSEGRALQDESIAWMTQQQIQNPNKMTALHAPGFPEYTHPHTVAHFARLRS